MKTKYPWNYWRNLAIVPCLSEASSGVPGLVECPMPGVGLCWYPRAGCWQLVKGTFKWRRNRVELYEFQHEASDLIYGTQVDVGVFLVTWIMCIEGKKLWFREHCHKFELLFQTWFLFCLFIYCFFCLLWLMTGKENQGKNQVVFIAGLLLPFKTSSSRSGFIFPNNHH